MSKRAKAMRAKAAPVAESEAPVTVDAYVPDYEHECENCGAVPVVTGMRDGVVVLATGMCGACTWGESDAIDPAAW